MNYSIQFEPFISVYALIALAVLAGLPLIAALILRRRAVWLRLLAAAFFAIALLNPVMLQEHREKLKSIVALVADNSQSQNFGSRKADTAKALAELSQKLKAYPQFEPRIIAAAAQGADTDKTENTETQLFAPLRQALADVPPSRIGGVILLTDGQIADIPPLKADASAAENAAALRAALGFNAPINALISGRPQEYDRRIRFVKAPRFGLSGKPLEVSFKIDDAGAMPADAGAAAVSLYVNGRREQDFILRPGQEQQAEITLPHVGANIIELATPAVPGELTPINNRAALIVDGVRENLKVLLVSGEPHNGLRAWRDLLKSDTGVDLVHFTILRPPEKADNTPLSELSLIVFPTTELFVNRLHDFDLVIFDRYQHYDVLPLIYYEYMARYVENGGALLVAAGSEYAGGASLALTPLMRVLPARPTGNIFEKPFLPQLTNAGRRHPVTQSLEGAQSSPPKWGRWLRQIEAEPQPGSETLMSGADNKPLLVLAQEGEGRAGMLLSDEGWLWARGYEGGGPYAALYRRMAHWLMKEPDLEAESLTAAARGHEITITRRTMQEATPAANAAGSKGAAGREANEANAASPIGLFRITLPSGKVLELTPQKQQAGLYTARFTSPETGLVRIENGGRTALVHAGAADIAEFADIIATPDKIAPLAAATGGHILPMHPNNGSAVNSGNIKAVANALEARAGSNDLVLQNGRDSRLVAQNRLPLFANIWALAAGLIILALIWRREGRR